MNSEEKDTSNFLGTMPMPQLILKQAVPSAIGILMMSLYMIIDFIFVGQWVGKVGLAALTIIMPINMLIATFGMSIGVGGASVISRALGHKDYRIAKNTFGMQIILFAIIMVVIMTVCFTFKDEILILFGAEGDIFPVAYQYFNILLPSIPALAWLMISNHVIRSEGNAKAAMLSMVVPAIINIILDFVFIAYFDWGIEGAAWATFIAYTIGSVYTVFFFVGPYNMVNFKTAIFKIDIKLIKEILGLGSVTLVRQGGVNVLAIIINKFLFFYGGLVSVAVYGIISKIMVFSFVPLLGIVQGFLPIVGYNYGAKKFDRVIDSIQKSIKYSFFVVLVMYSIVLIFPTELTRIFTDDKVIIDQTQKMLPIVFSLSPLFSFQMIGTAYFQGIGKPLPALILTIIKQFILIVPAIIVFSYFHQIEGVFYAFPFSDLIATCITAYYLWFKTRKTIFVTTKYNA